MQVLIGYSLERGHEDGVATRLGRVAAHYDELWEVPFTRRGRDAAQVGLHVWDATEPPWQWPVWQENPTFAVATLGQPLGYERVVGELPSETAALALGRALLDRPEEVTELLPAFVVATLEPEGGRVTLITDALGFGPLFELRFPSGWVLSNRPAAACLFAGTRAVADLIGWRTFAATGWFMGNNSPFESVYAVPAGTQVMYEGARRVERRVDTLGALVADRRGDALCDKRLDEVADALQDVARAVPRVFPGEVVLRLSGGRDSRVVAAAFLSAGVDVKLQTDDVEPGEARFAQELVAALPRRVTLRVDSHVCDTPTEEGLDASDDGAATLERARSMHRLREGLRPAPYLAFRPRDRFLYPDHAIVGGEGGEVARGWRYPPNFTELEGLPYSERIDGFVHALIGSLLVHPARSLPARDATGWQVRRVLHDAAMAGVTDAKMLNYFFAAEKLRRWANMTELNGIVAPLLVPEFLSAAFDLTSAQSQQDALHRALTERLMPAWGGIPYYEHPGGKTHPALRPRLGSAPDHDLISALLTDSASWGDGYDVAAVRRAWRGLRNGGTDATDEHLLQHVIWRAVFDDYLADLNGEKPPSRPMGAAAVGGREIGGEAAGRMKRFVARVLRKVARMMDPT